MRSRLENDTTVENTTRVPRSLSFRKLSTRCTGVGSDKGTRFNDEGKRFDGRETTGIEFAVRIDRRTK